MSYIHIDRAKTIAAPVIYVVYGSLKAAKEGQVRAEQVTAVSAEGLRRDEWAGVDFIDEGNELLRPHAQRSNKCLTYIQSWSVDEFDKTSPRMCSGHMIWVWKQRGGWPPIRPFWLQRILIQTAGVCTITSSF